MNRIKKLRHSKSPNLTQQRLAELVGVARSTVAMWEAGKNEPDNETLLKLAEIFNVSTDCVLGVPSNQDLPKLRIKNRMKNWKSNKAGRVFMCIDSGLLDLIDIFAREDGISLEDEIEKILHEEAENRTEEEMSDASDREFADLPPEKLYPHQRTDAPAQTVSEVSMESTRAGQDQTSQQKKPTPVTEDGLDEMFMRYVQELTPDQQLMILEQMQRMTGQQKEPSSVFAQQITGETTP